MFELLLTQHNHWILLRGLAAVFLLAMPVNLFVSIMGGGAPQSKGFLYSLGVVIGMEVVCVVAFLFIAKIVDSLLMFAPAWNSFSYTGILIAAIVFTIAFNIFVDRGFQFKQGNYAISVYGLFALLLFWTVVILIGRWVGRFL